MGVEVGPPPTTPHCKDCKKKVTSLKHSYANGFVCCSCEINRHDGHTCGSAECKKSHNARIQKLVNEKRASAELANMVADYQNKIAALEDAAGLSLHVLKKDGSQCAIITADDSESELIGPIKYALTNILEGLVSSKVRTLRNS